MALARLKEFLDGHNTKYATISHSVAYTASEIAALTHIPGKELAKTVIVKVDGRLAMAVLPASSQVDLSRLKAAADAADAVLASEREFKDIFPDCEAGAMPPFGNLYDLPVFADESLSRDKGISLEICVAGPFSILLGDSRLTLPAMPQVSRKFRGSPH